jgi:hypothetical protein
MNQRRDPIILILAIPRLFEDALVEPIDALDFEIKGVPLP